MGKIEIFEDNISGNAIYFHHLFSDDLIFRVYVNWGWGCYYLGNYCSIVSWSNQLRLLLNVRICLLYFYNHFLYKTKELLLRKGLRKIAIFFHLYLGEKEKVLCSNIINFFHEFQSLFSLS